MDAWLSDGLHFPSNVPISIGGAPAPCPDSVEVGPQDPNTLINVQEPQIFTIEVEEGLGEPEPVTVDPQEPDTFVDVQAPQVFTVVTAEEDPACPGDAIEGIGTSWTWAFASDQTTPFAWPPLFSTAVPPVPQGNQLSGSGTYTINAATGGLTPFGIGQRRVNTAVRGGTGVCFRRPAPSGMPVLGRDFHIRMIFRELTTLGTHTYFEYFVDVDNLVRIQKIGTDLIFTVIVAASTYTFTVDVTLIIGSYVLLDWFYDFDNGSSVAQHQVFLNGVQLIAPAHTSLLGPLAADGTFALLANLACAENAESLELIFMGLRNLQQMTLADHAADAVSLGVI